MLPGDPSVKDGEKRLKRMVEKRLLQPESHQTQKTDLRMDVTPFCGRNGWEYLGGVWNT